jgi:glycerophosphoryl diester phosphodiesterase
MHSRPLFVGHRGDSAHAPENTLPALAAAVRAGADAVEFDVRLAADGVPVVIHDADLRRFGGALRVARSTSAMLATADAGAWFAPGFAGTGVPTLAAWLTAAPTGLGLCLELKPGRADADALVRAVLRELRRHRALDRTWLLCFAAAPLVLAHRLEPHLRLVRNVVRLPRAPRHWLAGQPPLAAVDADITALSAAQADALRACGVPLWCWTCTTAAHLRRARRLGCAAVIANDPAWSRRTWGR